MIRPAFLLTAILAFSTTPSAQEPQWYRGNLHAHSLWSDGNDFPEMIADWYRKNGYHFLALSDHNILSVGQKWVTRRLVRNRGGFEAYEEYLARFGPQWVESRGDPSEDTRHEIRLKPLNEFRGMFEEPGKFLMIQAEEITDIFGKHQVHLNATNLAELIRPQGGGSVREVMERNLAVAQTQEETLGRPIMVHLNHPNFQYSITAEDLAAVVSERYFEVHNGHPGTFTMGDKHHPGTEKLWDIANTIRLGKMKKEPLFGLATDDSHHYHGRTGRSYSRVGRGWVMVRARHLTPESLIRAMRAGDFYSSSGVELKELKFDGSTLRLAIAPKDGEKYTTRFVGTPVVFDDHSEPRSDAAGNPVTRSYSDDIGTAFAEVKGNVATYRLTGRELFVRAVITSSASANDPSFDGQKKMAWTQPVGWRSRIPVPAKPGKDG